MLNEDFNSYFESLNKNYNVRNVLSEYAVIYARFSSSMQKEESIETQVEACKKYAEEKGIKIVDVYIDKAESGQSTKRRNGFNRMMVDAKSKRFSKVLLYKLDRFARNMQEHLKHEYTLNMMGVEVISVTQPLSNSPQDIMLKAVLIAQNEYYSANLAQDVASNKKTHALKGNYSGGNTPYGYERLEPLEDSEYMFKIVESEAIVVRKMFEMYQQGYGYGKITEELEALGIRTKSGKVFNRGQIRSILTSEVYIGNYIYNKTSKKNINGIKKKVKNPKSEWIYNKTMFPPIVDEKLFYSVRKIINDYENTAKKRIRTYNYLLTSKCKCGSCNYSYVGGGRRSTPKKQGLYYYKCIGKNSNQMHDCKNKMIRADLLEEYVVKLIFSKIYSDKMIEKYIENIYRHFEGSKDNTRAKVKKIKKQLEKVVQDQDVLFQKFTNGKIKERQFDRLNENYDKQIELYEQEIETLVLQSSDTYSRDSIRKYLNNIREDLKLDEEDISLVIDNTVDKVIVNEDTVDIYFKVFAPSNEDGINLDDYVYKVDTEPSVFTLGTITFVFYYDGSISIVVSEDRDFFNRVGTNQYT